MIDKFNGKYKLIILATVLGVVFAGLAASTNAEQELSKIIFYVGWYDVGKSALAGLKGVVKVKSGFLGSREINTVFYNPNLISAEKMIKVLKKAGTYRGVAEENWNKNPYILRIFECGVKSRKLIDPAFFYSHHDI